MILFVFINKNINETKNVIKRKTKKFKIIILIKTNLIRK